MSEPLISVVTTVKNAKSHIETCVFSVQAAGFSSFEHVISDGGSSDGTWEAACALGDTVGRGIKCIQSQDRSMTEGLRNACAAASGQWILPLNADDQYAPAVGARIEAALKNSAADIVFFDVALRRSSGKLKYIERPWLGASVWAWDILGCFIVECGVAIRKTALEQVGGYDESYRLAADYDLYRKIVVQGKAEHYPVLLGFFNETEQNLSHTQKDLILQEAGKISRYGSLYAWMQSVRLDKILRVILGVQRYDVG